MHDISSFWKPLLAGVAAAPSPLQLPGWRSDNPHETSFVQAEISLRTDFSDTQQPVWFIAAPGAVGKSTLAKEICAATNAIYVDLAVAATVGGSYVVGGLVNNGLWKRWEEGSTALLIDALDEARLRVTQSSFEDFLKDVANVGRKGKLPIVLLGRVGIVEEAWSILEDREKISAPIFDIELFDRSRAERFVMATLHKLASSTMPDLRVSLNAHSGVYSEAIRELMDGIAGAAVEDGRRFIGYAPVLEAIAKVIAAETNPARIGEAMHRILQGQILERLCNEVMTREAGKLTDQLKASVDTSGWNVGIAYGPEEQLDRLATRVLSAGKPSLPPGMPPEIVGPYEEAVASLLPQHPFLDGAGKAASSAVFGARILADALESGKAEQRRAAEQYARLGRNAPNPFLFEFYKQRTKGEAFVPAEHVGILFESAQARMLPGESCRLSVECGAEDEFAEVELLIVRAAGEPERIELKTNVGGTLKFGRRVAGVNIEADRMDVELGVGGQLEIVAPVSINARALYLQCDELVVRLEHGSQQIDNSVSLEASEVLAEASLKAPVVRPGAELSVSWPTANEYPWSQFATLSDANADTDVAEALRALRRLVIAFRSHSKGQLARYRGKIEHARMTKGVIGARVRERLIQDSVLRIEGKMYILDPDALGARVGLSFLDAKLKRYGDGTKQYVRSIIAT